MQKITYALALMPLLFLSGCRSNPFPEKSRWVGQYECTQGWTDLQLHIVKSKGRSVKAIFDFDHKESGAAGKFYLYGTYNPWTNNMVFAPGEWIERPPRYLTVGMEGYTYQDPLRYEGHILFEGCRNFKLTYIPDDVLSSTQTSTNTPQTAPKSSSETAPVDEIISNEPESMIDEHDNGGSDIHEHEPEPEREEMLPKESGPDGSPFYIFTDRGSRLNHYIPSGWMGDFGDIRFNQGWQREGDNTCIQIKYTAEKKQGAGWAGIYWQNPANNWGDKRGGYDFTGYTKLIFSVRGDKSGERVKFGVGGITGQTEKGDSGDATLGPVSLTTEWKTQTIDLSRADLTHIIGGFMIYFTADDNPGGCTVYLDDIRFEK